MLEVKKEQYNPPRAVFEKADEILKRISSDGVFSADVTEWPNIFKTGVVEWMADLLMDVEEYEEEDRFFIKVTEGYV